MINYLENENGSLSFSGMTIPASESNRHYRQALQEVQDGEATIEVWEGSQRQADYDAVQAAQDWKSSRAVAVSQIIVTVDGMEFDGDETSQNRMARAVSAADADNEETLWVLANNTPAMVTALQLRQALKLAGQAQTALWVQE